MSVPIRPDRSEIVESDGPGRWEPGDGLDSPQSVSANLPEKHPEQAARRILFLDDDPRRAEVFLDRNPEAVWIQTARECIAKLTEPWDEVYLDHDLGGEHYVDVERDDCGMEVVRWLCREPVAHLIETPFVIHSHNLAAALMMVLLMRETGYRAEFLPFGFNMELDPYSLPAPGSRTDNSKGSHANQSGCRRLFGWLTRLFGRSKVSPPDE